MSSRRSECLQLAFGDFFCVYGAGFLANPFGRRRSILSVHSSMGPSALAYWLDAKHFACSIDSSGGLKQDGLRDYQIQLLGGRSIYVQLDHCRKFDWEIARICPFDDPVHEICQARP